eukprot:TRINITY_DN5186_c0_g1_i2.p1 TRINITY_DN5186_c0_g1~~TRINITY_DN5186_c0_g1_i2.p1  ORF type:complete len:163 (-),score=25.65 TRINITY_DN5186_c0_g1_i2:144-599(-)
MIAVLGMLLAACVVRAEKMHTPNKHRLKAVFDELGGPKWRNSNGWVPFEGTDPCEGGWYGVGCDEDGYLESLNLANNGLSGEIPGRDLGMWSNLKHMLTLDFSSNELRGNFLGLTVRICTTPALELCVWLRPGAGTGESPDDEPLPQRVRW